MSGCQLDVNTEGQTGSATTNMWPKQNSSVDEIISPKLLVEFLV